MVEPTITLSGKRECTPECLLVSSKVASTIAVESKSGGCNSEDQIQRYDSLRASDLAAAALDIPKPALANVAVVLIAPMNEIQRHVDQLSRLKSQIAAIGYDSIGGRFQLKRGTTGVSRLDEQLRGGICIAWPPTPCDYIPFDGQSTDIEVASAVVNGLMAQALARRKRVELAEICRESVRYWHALDPRHKTKLGKKIARAVEHLCVMGFAGQFEIATKKRGFAVDITAQARRAAGDDLNAYARRLRTMAENALTEIQRKLDEEQKQGEVGLFKGTMLPPQKRKSRRR